MIVRIENFAISKQKNFAQTENQLPDFRHWTTGLIFRLFSQKPKKFRQHANPEKFRHQPPLLGLWSHTHPEVATKKLQGTNAVQPVVRNPLDHENFQKITRASKRSLWPLRPRALFKGA
jgi:hypothetical protein